MSSAYAKHALPNNVFKNIPPIILETQNGKQYKFDIDILHQTVVGPNGEPFVSVNKAARGDNIKLQRGEEISLTYGAPFGFNDFVKASLLKGKVVVNEGTDGRVSITGTDNVFLREITPGESTQGQIPSVEKGRYELVILITYNEEDRGYYITKTTVN